MSIALLFSATILVTTAAPDGEQDGACFGNRTCMSGLRCDDTQICRAIPKIGELQGACFPNNTCHGDFQCVEGLCAAAPDDGEKGGACYRNNTCNTGLSCVQTRCEQHSVARAPVASRSTMSLSAATVEAEPSFGERYFNPMPPSDPHSSANTVAHIAGGCLFSIGGPVWLPMLVGDAPEGYLKDAFVGWLTHMAVFSAAYALVGVGSLFNPAVGSAASLALSAAVLVDAMWGLPMVTLNAWDRAARKQEAKRGRQAELVSRRQEKEAQVAMAF